MNCPKCKHVTLLDTTLAQTLKANHCSNCQGNWIRGAEYEEWQSQQPQQPLDEELFLYQVSNLDVSHSLLDSKAALCPECNRYLSRAKVSVKKPFFVERCPNCTGIWCDEGEWDILEKLGLSTMVEQLFSSPWQTWMREQQHAQQERQAVIDKIGSELADQLFKLASMLEKHPNGDFAAAYLMRRFETDKVSYHNDQNP